MAWTDQCRIAFRANAEGLLWRQEKETKKNLMKILAQLSEDSGIPQKTLYRWWREEEKRIEKNLKNETFDENEITIQNNTENNQQEFPDIQDEQVMLRQYKSLSDRLPLYERSYNLRRNFNMYPPRARGWQNI